GEARLNLSSLKSKSTQRRIEKMTAVYSVIFTAVLIAATAYLKKKIERELSVLDEDRHGI
ncbi:MAG: hypothetical protein ACI4F2_04185, partial [Acutalibacteraceae bacterium]